MKLVKNLLMLACAFASVATASAMAADATSLRYGLEAQYPPFESKGANGELQGFDIDVGNAVCKTANLKCSWVETSFDGLIPALQGRKFDAINSAMNATDKRRQAIDFTNVIYRVPTQLIARKDSGLQPTPESLKGKRVGVLQASIQETFAKTHSADRDPVGRGISLGRQTVRIVGVVADIHDDGLDVPVAARIYLPLFQRSGNALTLFYRSSVEPGSLTTAVERAIHSVDPSLPVFGQSTMETLLADSTVRRKVVLSLMGAFALVALLLAAIGTYGVMSVAASQRVREIGIRLALGAQIGDIERLMVRPGLILAASGVAIGVVGAAFLSRLMNAVLFAVAPTDALTYASVLLLLILVALGACYVPARRATRLDPLIALRNE